MAATERHVHTAGRTAAQVRNRRPELYRHERVGVIVGQASCRIANLVDKNIAQRQAASRFLKDLVDLDVFRELQAGKEQFLIHPQLIQLLSSDSNAVEPYVYVRVGSAARASQRVVHRNWRGAAAPLLALANLGQEPWHTACASSSTEQC